MKSLAFLSVLLIAGLSCAPAFASDGYNFVSEYIHQISALESIRAEAESNMSQGDDSRLADCIRNSTRFRLELAAQISILRSISFKPANDQLKDVIPTLITWDQQKLDLWQQFGEACATMMAGPKPGVDYGKLAAKMPKITAQLQYADESIFKMTPLIFALLVDMTPDSQNHVSHLTVTKEEKDKLVSSIDSLFGKNLQQNNQNYMVSSVSVLKSYLEKFKGADESR